MCSCDRNYSMFHADPIRRRYLDAVFKDSVNSAKWQNSQNPVAS